MPQQSFVYVIYIRTTAQKLWEALITPEFTRQFWFGFHQESAWTPGAAWKLVSSDGRIADAGEVMECDPPKRLVLKWHHELYPELRGEGDTRCAISLEPDGEMVKLTVVHEAERPITLIEKVAGGWPSILSSLKSMLETGKPLPRSR
jgi:uncharacterized protein YndB with AHSA1/START domain